VQELIELSRLQGAEPLPGQQLVAVSQVLSEAVDRSRLLAEQSGITVVLRSEPGLQARGNETQLATAIANLVDNAIAYSPERTKVGVSSRAVVDPSGAEWIEIAVTDQGIGIAEPDLDRVFERFFRVDPARSRATGGTGLGLAIVKHIATNHGGAVSVWSVYGSGSTFTIRLPLAGRQARDEHADAAEAAELPERPPAPEPPVVMPSDSAVRDSAVRDSAVRDSAVRDSVPSKQGRPPSAMPAGRPTVAQTTPRPTRTASTTPDRR
jgi:two-component system sensor histidine kinase SenX3